MTLQHVDWLFQLVVFLFAISVHESAHAWMAWRLGDPTARMLGRVTLNPIKHIDPIGTILLPAIALITHFPVIGWAKPTPVNPRNFKHYMRDDVLTSVAGPISNFIIASISVVLLLIMILAIPGSRPAIYDAISFKFSREFVFEGQSSVVPIALLLYNLMFINILLGIFNLIPVPPLDGSHVLRHVLPDSFRRVYDSVGMFGLIILVFWGGDFLGALLFPVIRLVNALLLNI